jgi:hypothetical protein
MKTKSVTMQMSVKIYVFKIGSTLWNRIIRVAFSTATARKSNPFIASQNTVIAFRTRLKAKILSVQNDR